MSKWSFCTSVSSYCTDLKWGNLYENKFLTLQSSAIILILGEILRVRGRRISWSNSTWKPVCFFHWGSVLELMVCLLGTNITGSNLCQLPFICLLCLLVKRVPPPPCNEWCCHLLLTETLLAVFAHFRFELAGKGFLLLTSSCPAYFLFLF